MSSLQDLSGNELDKVTLANSWKGFMNVTIRLNVLILMASCFDPLLLFLNFVFLYLFSILVQFKENNIDM